MIVNQHPVLQCSTDNPQAGREIRLEQTEDRIKKNKREKTKRGCERHRLERISRLFKVAGSEQTWTRVDVLIFGMATHPSVGSADFSPNPCQPLRSSSTVQVPFLPASLRPPPSCKGYRDSRYQNTWISTEFLNIKSMDHQFNTGEQTMART